VNFLPFLFSSHILTAAIGLLSIIFLLVVVYLWKKLKKEPLQLQGASFRSKVVRTFSFFVVGPCLTMALLAILFLEVGVQSWFHQRVKTALRESEQIAQLYLKEHQKTIEKTIKDMALGFDDYFHRLFAELKPLLIDDQSFFQQYRTDFEHYLTAHEAFRSVKEAMIFQVLPSHAFPPSSPSSPPIWLPISVVAQSRFSLSAGFKNICSSDIATAESKGIFMSLNEEKSQVFAIVPIFAPIKAYLLVTRNVDQAVLNKVKNATEATHAYKKLMHTQRKFAFQFIILFILLTSFLLLWAVWKGLSFSTQFMTPIEGLIDASQALSQGEEKTVSSNTKVKELVFLTKTFNSMVKDIHAQKNRLIEVNQQIKKHSALIENVLSGISSGVLSLNGEHRIVLTNQRACLLLCQKTIDGKMLKEVAPEFESLLWQAVKTPLKLYEQECVLWRKGKQLNFKVSVLVEEDGFAVLTFDDITALISAQKKAAWSDVARRIAHEVKNPLTPVVLSAERLKRRYLKSVENPEIFQDCIETIVKQVAYLGKLISEFSMFARLPSPKIQKIDFKKLILQQVHFQQQAYPEVDFITSLKDITFFCDPDQMSQVLANVLKNSIDSLQEKKLRESLPNDLQLQHAQQGKIEIFLSNEMTDYKEKVILKICDNGIGLPEDKTLILDAPYVTTKTEGTGLGLAIVKKIIEDHCGEMYLQNNPSEEGACITFIFFIDPETIGD
jgi:two-component system, NtrC family, nitrogen regulation sensor histidine kinase NtrY